jgi:hypothetical protein
VDLYWLTSSAAGDAFHMDLLSWDQQPELENESHAAEIPKNDSNSSVVSKGKTSRLQGPRRVKNKARNGEDDAASAPQSPATKK